MPVEFCITTLYTSCGGKKWPLYQWAEAFSVDVGVIWYTNRKYQGALAEMADRIFTFMLRPNIEF